MRRKDFESSPTGGLVRVEGDVWAFVPEPLRPLGSYSPQMVELIGDAEAALGKLRGIGERLANPHLLIMPYVRREAVLSSKIEGTQTTLSDLFRAEVDAMGANDDRDVQEVRNYVTALSEALQGLDQLPLSLRLIKNTHRTLLTGVRGHTRAPGEFRRDQNFIGPKGSKIQDARYVPPPVPEMKEALGAWEKFLHVRDGIPPLVQCAMAHYQFEAIHPFSDGNGRVGRLLITLFLCDRDRLRQPLLYLSAYFERNQEEYYDRLLAVSRHGDWDGWIMFFLRGVAEQSTAAASHAERILVLHKQYRERLQEMNATGSTLEVLDALFANPYTTAGRIMSATSRSHPTAQKIIDRLVEARILRQLAAWQRWRRVYCAEELLRTLEG